VAAWRCGFDGIVVCNQHSQPRVSDPVEQLLVATLKHRAGVFQHMAVGLPIHFQNLLGKSRMQTNHVTIFNGGIYSAACMRGNGTVAVYSDTEVGNYYTTDLNLVGGATVSPYPQKATEDLPDFSLDPPNCSGLTNFGEVKKPDAAHPIGPGIYSKITVGNNDDLVMNPGLYCVGAFSISGGTVTGSGVTIYMNGTGSNDWFTVSGGTVSLEAPGDDSLSPAVKGLLVYMGHASSVNLGGNADSYYAGTVYAPRALIDVGGTSDINPTYSTQLIGDTVTVHGTARIDINFDLSSIFQDPSYVDLYR
jgi:hypothetical protein